MKWFARLVTVNPVSLLLVLLALTVVAAHGIIDLRTGALRLQIDPGLDRLLPEGDDERRFYDHARKTFGSDEFLLLVVESGDIFTPTMLERLQKVTARLEREPDVLRVVSLANATDVVGIEGEIVISPFYDDPPQDAAGRRRTRRTA